MTTMTTLAPPVRSGPANLRSLSWTRMAWVTWRQHRTALSGVGVLFVVVAAGFWIAGLQLHHAYSSAVACRPASSFACGDLINTFNGTNTFLANGLILQLVPPLIGAFVGAPVLAREMESGTFRFAWTQGFGRWRWTLAKLVALAVAGGAGTGALSVLFSWYYRPYLAASNQGLSLSKGGTLRAASPFDLGLFNVRGVTFAAWTLAAFSIGALAGILIRRVVPAIVATLVAYTGLAFAAGGFLRQRYLAPMVTSSLQVPDSAWIIGRQWTKGGRPVSQFAIDQILQQGGTKVAGKGGIPQSLGAWQYLVGHGYTQLTTYQPASRFWPFQWVEGGWLLALSVLCIAVTVWFVRSRAS